MTDPSYPTWGTMTPQPTSPRRDFWSAAYIRSLSIYGSQIAASEADAALAAWDARWEGPKCRP